MEGNLHWEIDACCKSFLLITELWPINRAVNQEEMGRKGGTKRKITDLKQRW